MFDPEYSHQWPPVPKPSAIDDLMIRKQIGKMSADEYRALARQAQTALQEGNRAKPPRR